MRKPFLDCMLLYLFFLTSQLWAAEENRIVPFTLFLRNNTVIRLDNLEKRLNIERSAFDIITHEKEGDAFRQVNKLEWPEITRNLYCIVLVDANRATYSKAKLLLTRQDDTQTVIQYGSLHYTDGTPVDRLYPN